MNTPTLLQFPTGDEATLGEWKEASTDVTTDDNDRNDPFVRWEAVRSLRTTIGTRAEHKLD